MFKISFLGVALFAVNMWGADVRLFYFPTFNLHAGWTEGILVGTPDANDADEASITIRYEVEGKPAIATKSLGLSDTLSGWTQEGATKCLRFDLGRQSSIKSIAISVTRDKVVSSKTVTDPIAFQTY